MNIVAINVAEVVEEVDVHEMVVALQIIWLQATVLILYRMALSEMEEECREGVVPHEPLHVKYIHV